MCTDVRCLQFPLRRVSLAALALDLRHRLVTGQGLFRLQDAGDAGPFLRIKGPWMTPPAVRRVRRFGGCELTLEAVRFHRSRCEAQVPSWGQFGPTPKNTRFFSQLFGKGLLLLREDQQDSTLQQWLHSPHPKLHQLATDMDLKLEMLGCLELK